MQGLGPGNTVPDLNTIDALQSALRDRLYVADRGLATTLFLALKLSRPVFLEGAPVTVQRELTDGDTVTLGKAHFIFKSVTASGAA